MKHCMIDLETLGTNPDCPVLSIGAVMFDPTTGRLGQEYYRVMDIDVQIDDGRKMSASTFKWWLGQSEAARRAIFQPAETVHPRVALEAFFDGFKQAGAVHPWSHGSTFDITIIEDMARQYGLEVPWKFWDVRDTRTLYDLANVRPPRAQGTHHNALDDARNQAKAAVQAYKVLGKDSA